MSTVNEKIIETRIINRVDELAAWNDSKLILKKGEIALAIVKKEGTEASGDHRPTGHKGDYALPTFMMKVGDGTSTFQQLNWLAAPASDVYTWAKREKLLYGDLPVEVEEQFNVLEAYFANGLTGATTVQGAIDYAINTTLTVDNDENTGVVKGITKSDNVISVTHGKITDSDIDDAKLSLTSIKGRTGSSNTSLNETINDYQSRLQSLEGMLSNTGKVMEFRGVYESTADATAELGSGVQIGDVIATTDGKEYVWATVDGTAQWVEFGHASATDATLATFAGKVFKAGLDAVTGTPGYAKDTLEARIDAIEYEIGETVDDDSHTSLRDRVSTAENTLINKVPQLGDSNNILAINRQVLIFDCGTAEVRSYLGEQEQATT